jgi:hypothetical protein
MATRKVVVEMSPKSIMDAVKMLKAYEIWVNKKIDELMIRLAAVGLETARVYFQMGATEGNEAPETWVEPIENGFKIIANGKDVFFIEFGAGDAAGNHPDAGNVPVATSPGSYSEKNTMEYVKYGSWHHDGKKYTELQPQMPMYHAMCEIERNVTKIAKEVFG